MPLGGSPSYCRRLVRRNQSPTTFVDSAKASALPSPVPRQSPVPCDLSVQSAISLTTSRHHYHHHPPPIHRDRTHTYTRYALSACSSCVDTRSCSLSSTRSYSQARSPSALCSACPVISFALGAFISPAIPTSPHRVLDDCERTASSSARDSV